MKIVVAHNYYQRTGGEDSIVAAETRLLQEHAHKISLLTEDNIQIKSIWRKIKAAREVTYSNSSLKRLRLILAQVRPDIVHVHNFFPILTPAVYDACVDARIPVVQTLHNYRTICAGALLMRDGRPCEDCIGGSPYQGALHGCYRGSRLASLAVARMVAIHRNRGTWRTKVDRFIALTEFAQAKFIEAGFPAGKISVKANFVENLVARDGKNARRKGALFVGRLSPEKGIDIMLATWSSMDLPLRIVGDGPMLDRVRSAGVPRVAVLGQRASYEVEAEMRRAAILVFPSECYETFGLTIIESFSCGLPVIASRLGAMAEIVEDGVTGLHFNPGDAQDLAAKVRWAAQHPEEMRRMGVNARKVYEVKYTPEANYRQLMTIYQEAIDENRRSGSGAPPRAAM